MTCSRRAGPVACRSAISPRSSGRTATSTRFDLFVKRELGCGAYLRYVDDFALFADSKATLWAMEDRH